MTEAILIGFAVVSYLTMFYFAVVPSPRRLPSWLAPSVPKQPRELPRCPPEKVEPVAHVAPVRDLFDRYDALMQLTDYARLQKILDDDPKGLDRELYERASILCAKLEIQILDAMTGPRK